MTGASVVFAAIFCSFVTAVPLRGPPVPEGSVLPSPLWYQQPLDQFDPSNNATWQQRYFVNASYWTQTGPVFLMLGGEGPANPTWLVADTEIMLNAQKYGAMVILLEHRYYGDSHPTEDTSLSNIKYLSSRQALADAVRFHDAIVAVYKMSSVNKWVVFGGSYSGALSAWMRILYPGIVVGAVASSGPVLAELNFYQYLEVVQSSLAVTTQGAQCNENILAAITELDKMLEDDHGWPLVDEQFFVAPPLQSIDDTRQLVGNLIDIFAGVVQYNKDNTAFEGRANAFTTDDLCNFMCDASKGTPLQRMAALNALFLKNGGQNTTDASYKDLVDGMRMSKWSDPSVTSGERQWYYQTCTEFGYFQTTDSDQQPFGDLVNLDSFTKVCYDVFNITQSAVLQSVYKTNSYYGGKDIPTNVTNIVFPNGSIDPWHVLGITQNITDQLPAIFINGTAHCANMYPPSSGDLPGLVSARIEISTLIGTWLMMTA